MKTRKPFFLCGGVKILVSGQDSERFFNIAVRRGLHICNIAEADGGAVMCWTAIRDLRQLKDIRRKTGVKIRIIERYGFPFLLKNNKGRKLFLVGFLAFFLFLYSWTFYIWDISVEGNQKYTDETLIHFMESLCVYNGIKKKEISCEHLEESIRNQFCELTWVSAEIKGTRLIVHVKENEALLSVDDDKEEPCHLIANKEGVIVRNVIRNGVGKVKSGDPIDKGQILVEGLIPIFDDSEMLVTVHKVHADAEIYAETKNVIHMDVPLLKQERIRTGKEHHGLFLMFHEHPFYLMFPIGRDGNWDYVMEQKQLKLFHNFYLPVYAGKICAYETSFYERLWTEDEVRERCNNYLSEYIENLTEKGVQILGSDGRIEKDESGWHFEGTLKVIENIAVEAAIPENQEENQTINECN